MWDKGYGKIEYLYSNSKNKTSVGEIMYFKDKKSFEKEIDDCIEIGCPINVIKYTELEFENERER